MDLVASTFHTTSEHGISIITTADTPTWAASSRLNRHPSRFKWTRPFRACAITFQLACSNIFDSVNMDLLKNKKRSTL
jgi:chromosomal replication initiation ATPase DnaA